MNRMMMNDRSTVDIGGANHGSERAVAAVEALVAHFNATRNKIAFYKTLSRKQRRALAKALGHKP